MWKQIVQVKYEDYVVRHMGVHWFSRDGSLGHDDWHIFFSRSLRGLEGEQLVELRGLVGGFHLTERLMDLIVWEPSAVGIFSVKEMSNLMHSFGLTEDVMGAFRVWDVEVPPKVQCFLWFVLLDRLPTLVLLRDRGVNLGEASLQCIWCGSVKTDGSVVTGDSDSNLKGEKWRWVVFFFPANDSGEKKIEEEAVGDLQSSKMESLQNPPRSPIDHVRLKGDETMGPTW
ncbi:hypothetical protein GQ457_01G018450 [Hibiscus cannabinus]